MHIRAPRRPTFGGKSLLLVTGHRTEETRPIPVSFSRLEILEMDFRPHQGFRNIPPLFTTVFGPISLLNVLI